MLSRDGWGGLVVTAASLLLFWLTLDLKDNPLVPFGPGFYPRIVLGLTAVLGLWLVASDLLSRKDRQAEEKAAFNYTAVALQFGVFGLYVAALPGFGFRLATVAYVAAANALMDPPKGARGWLRVAVLGVLTSLLTYYIFERYLQVLMPRGRWTGF